MQMMINCNTQNYPGQGFPLFPSQFQQPGNYVQQQQQQQPVSYHNLQQQQIYGQANHQLQQQQASFFERQYTNMSTPGYRPLPPPRQPNFHVDLKTTNQDARQKTPQPQPPSQFYNGPPVSALVPRFPRQAKTPPTANRRNSLSTASFVGRSSLGPEDVTKKQPEEIKPSTIPSAPKTGDGPTKSEQDKKHQSSPAVRQPFADTAENQPRPATQQSTDVKQDPSENSPKKPSSDNLIENMTENATENMTENTAENMTAQPSASNTDEEDCFPCPVPIDFPRRLSLPNDHIKLNSLHCFLRDKVLEIFVVTASGNKLKFRHAPSSSVGRVGFRCGFCAAARLGTTQVPEDEAPMAVFYPKSTSEIYRLVTSWQRCHVRKCRNLPPSLRKEWEELRHDKTRGKTAYWAESAAKLGLVDCKSLAGGIRFQVDKTTGKCETNYNDE